MLTLGISASLIFGCVRTEPLPEQRAVPPVDAQPTGNCVLDERGGVCTAGGCTLVIQPDALSVATPVVIRRIDVPSEVRPEVFGDIACQLGPSTLDLATPARLILEVSEPAAGFEREDAVAVFVNGAALTLATDTQVQPGGRGVALSVERASVVALTFLAAQVRQVSEISADATSVDDTPSLIRTLSSRRFIDAEFDGQRLYLAAGDRVLVYADGIPADARQAPDFVLGARSLTAREELPSAASFGARVHGLWSDGTRLAVAVGNRVLIWNRPPTESFTPADIVLGQPNFTEGVANRGRDAPGADTLFAPNQIESDGTRFAVADSQNHRVLIWNEFPRFVGQPADFVIGQADFDMRQARAGAMPFFQARGVFFGPRYTLFSSTLATNCVLGVAGFPTRSNVAADLCIGVLRRATRVGPLELSWPGALEQFDAEGFAVRDFIGRRITAWRQFPEQGEPPDIVIGKPAFDVGGERIGGVNASSIADDDVFAGFYSDQERMIVPDGHRVLIFEPPPEYSFAPATRVLGQATFTTRQPQVDYGELDDDSLARPGGISVKRDAVAIADTANDRVLLFPSRLDPTPVTLGQPDPRAYGPNRFGPPSLATLSGPEAVLLDDGRLYVADTGNHRVLVWLTLPESDGQPADLVLGQADGTGTRPNRGATDLDGDGFIEADRSGLFYPSGLAVGAGHLFVADSENNRVLGFALSSLQTGAQADIVLGQEDFSGRSPNLGGGHLTPAEGGMANPTALAASGVELYVADTENNRVLWYPDVAQSTATVIGQDNQVSHRAPNFTPAAGGVPLAEGDLAVAANTLRRPRGLALSPDGLYIADTGNNRVVKLTRPLGPDRPASTVIGQPDFESRVPNSFGPGGLSLAGPGAVAFEDGRLWVLDRENHRLLTFDPGRLRPDGSAAPIGVFGQPSFVDNGFNRSLGDQRNLADPVGVVRAGGTTWVADRARNRILGFVDGEASIVLGQDNLTGTLANAGMTPSAATLSGPSGLATDGVRLVVADTENHRVLVWNQLPTNSGQPADVVVGQARFEDAESNLGNGFDSPSRSSLRLPRGVHLDEDRLIIADTGNNRVLIFNLVPQSNGTEASEVLCQPDFVTSLPNGGGAGAAADRCHAPYDATAVGRRIAIADTLNDRVLLFAQTGEDGRSAELVLGQPDFESKGASEVTATTLSGPVAIASDDVNIVVADGANNRVMVYFEQDIESGAPARQVVGQSSFETRSPSRAATGLTSPAGIYVERVSFIESRLVISDNGNGRVVGLSGIRR